MNLERLLSMSGLAGVMTDPFWYAQIGTLAFSAFLFVCCLVLCFMAFRSAGAARRAHQEALDLAVEVRRLTAQVENATSRRAAAVQDEPAILLSDQDIAAPPAADREYAANADRTLEDAKSAATVPSALLSRLARRRR